MVAGLSCTTHGQIYVIEVKFHGLQIRVTPDGSTAPALTRFSILDSLPRWPQHGEFPSY